MLNLTFTETRTLSTIELEFSSRSNIYMYLSSVKQCGIQQFPVTHLLPGQWKEDQQQKCYNKDTR